LKFLKKEKDVIAENPNTEDELTYVSEARSSQINAEGGTRQESEEYWDDEYLGFIGRQWDTSIAPRSRRDKTIRPNAVNNFILPTVMNIVDGLTTSTPESEISGREDEDDMIAETLKDVIPFVLDRNNFHDEWKEIVLNGISYGPFVAAVLWDPNFIGGSGPNRWVGEIRVIAQDIEEIYFDPAIKNLEKRMQECEFIHRKYPKKLAYIKEVWEENGKYVTDEFSETVQGDTTDLGAEPNQANILEKWHKGTPRFMPDYWKKRFLEKAEEAKEAKRPYKEKEYRDKAKGTLKGVHCSYQANGVFLEYIPYIFDDGLYPFVYRVLYKDKRNPHGFGEIRNILNPQVLYNKLDEIEMEAACVEGLGGGWYRKGSISKVQHDEYMQNGFKAGYWQEVNDPSGMTERQATQTPQSLLMMKDNKKKTIDTTSQNTQILQGISPGANVPNASIKDLGARADVRAKGKTEILEGFLTETVKLIVNRIPQFYTDEREYRIRGDKNGAIQKLIYKGMKEIVAIEDPRQRLPKMIEMIEMIATMDPKAAAKYGKIKNTDLMRENERDEGTEDYIPDMDIVVRITDERPSSRNYFEQLAMALYGKAMGPNALWTTIIEGKLPSKEEILSELAEMQKQAAAGQEMEVKKKDINNATI